MNAHPSYCVPLPQDVIMKLLACRNGAVCWRKGTQRCDSICLSTYIRVVNEKMENNQRTTVVGTDIHPNSNFQLTSQGASDKVTDVHVLRWRCVTRVLCRHTHQTQDQG